MINIRPHHLLCIPRFRRGGYAKEGFSKICSEIRGKPETKIRIIKRCDDICQRCPNKNQKICKNEEFNKEILFQDNFVLKRLKLKENSTNKVKEIFNLSIKEITNDDIRNICVGCLFFKACLKWGINKSFAKDLNNE